MNTNNPFDVLYTDNCQDDNTTRDLVRKIKKKMRKQASRNPLSLTPVSLPTLKRKRKRKRRKRKKSGDYSKSDILAMKRVIRDRIRDELNEQAYNNMEDSRIQNKNHCAIFARLVLQEKYAARKQKQNCRAK